MAPDRVCTIIVACAVLHNMAIDSKQPMLEDTIIDHSIDEPPAIQETAHLAAKHYRDQFAIHNFS